MHRDYLGSILAITDADGDVIEERQFGAWSSVDKFLDSNANTVFGHGSLLGRGYTGHEHFFEVSLIHMNGRMYDPIQGRFLSPDNYIQDPFNTQNYNRYGYVLNNPLMYVDPSGEYTDNPEQQPFYGGENGGWIGNGIANILNNWDHIDKWVNGWLPDARDAIARPFRETGRWFRKRLGLDGKSDKGETVQKVYRGDSPMSMSADVRGPDNLAIFSVSGGGGMAPIGSFKELPKQDFSGFWGGASYFWNGGIVDGYRYNIQGEAVGVAPIMGIVNVDKGSLGLVQGIRSLWKGVRGLSSAAKGVPKYLYHYTSREAAQSISQSGLRVGRDGFSYLTNTKSLSPLQAQIELALPANRALPNSLLRINTSGLSPAAIRRVQGNLHGLGAGGGTEFLFNQTIPASAIKIIR